MKGHFVISLDYEIHWGVFDKKSVQDYHENLSSVNFVIDRLLELSNRYDVKLTFSTVGLLFAENKEDLILHSPRQKPSYSNTKFNPYNLISDIGNSERDDPFHYALSGIQKIKNTGNHELGTHTFCHFYCHELGQTAKQFSCDLKAAKNIANKHNIEIKSIVFPRNMIEADNIVDKPYLDVCEKHGITSFRGKEKSFIYNIHTTKAYHGWYIFKLLRLLDSYVNLTGQNTYNVEYINQNRSIINLPSSRLLRAFSNRLKIMEPLKIRRITKAMTHAAQNNEMFHLWWHPHNFGAQINENFNNLETIFKHFKLLNSVYGFESETMTGLSNKIKR